MANQNSVSNDFWPTFVDSINVFYCRLSDLRCVSVCVSTNNLKLNFFRIRLRKDI